MIIKKLLLGSAAMLVTVAGARAADVIVPAAEPAEYVKVCDVYGTGFYYIPGTETCMQIGGSVRFKYAAANNTAANLDGDDYDARSRVRVRLDFDIREETELGTLRGFGRVQAQNQPQPGSDDSGYVMEQGYIQLGGLTMGLTDTLWMTGSGLLTDTNLAVGDFRSNQIRYTASFGAWNIAAAVEDNLDLVGDTIFVGPVLTPVVTTANRFAPNGILRAGYESELFEAFVAASIESKTNDTTTVFGIGPAFPGGVSGLGDGDDTAVALKGGVTFKPVQDGELHIEGSYAFDPTVYSTIELFSGVTSATTVGFGTGVVSILPFTATALPVEWQVGAGYKQSFGKLSVAASGAIGETFSIVGISGVAAPITTVDFGSGDYYRVVGNVGYEITNNFNVLGEVSYTNVDFAGANIDQTTGFLQFVRSF